jgi:hypothetical protein
MIRFLMYFIHLILLESLKMKYRKNMTVKIFDIDNTLANTYPTICANGQIPFSTLSVFPKVLEMVKKNCADTNTLVLFFTVRPIRYWLITYWWLNRQTINTSLFNLFICQYPMQKVDLIDRLKKRWSKITLVDDLSYNHEQGEVRFYSSVIDEIKAREINYIGYSELRELQQVIN